MDHQCGSQTALSCLERIARFHAYWCKARVPDLPGFPEFIEQQISHRKESEGASRQLDLQVGASHPNHWDSTSRASDSEEVVRSHLHSAWLSRVGPKGGSRRHFLSRKEHQANFTPCTVEKQSLPEQNKPFQKDHSTGESSQQPHFFSQDGTML